jgi:hypothetical protein
VATLATREPVGRVEVEERSGWRRRDPGSSEGVDSA